MPERNQKWLRFCALSVYCKGSSYAEAITLVIALIMSFVMLDFLRDGSGHAQEPGRNV